MSSSTISTRVPLAARLRPCRLEDYIGQEHLLGTGGVIRTMLDAGALDSIIMTGPPGVGKTTLAQLLAQTQNAHFEILPAVSSGIKDIRQVLDAARHRNQPTVVFVDEIHRFNKSQQDAFLPAIEEGTVIFLGATTENPGFYVNNALQSRVHLVFLKSLSKAELHRLLDRALIDDEFMASRHLTLSPDAAAYLCDAAHGDARRLLNMLEALAKSAKLHEELTVEVLKKRISHLIRFDRHGDEFYECISALHKSVRGSDPDAGLYWMLRMLEGGCDPAYVIRRLLRIASEDVGNADPRALQVCIQAADAYERLGMPEGELALAQAVIYLAVAPKSNAVYMAYKAAKEKVRTSPSFPVPDYLCNAPTKADKQKGKAIGYQYPHDYEDAYIKGINYFPQALQGMRFYAPVERGLEQQIAAKLRRLRDED